MTLNVTFKKVEEKEKLKNIILRKTKKLKKYLTNNVNMAWNINEDSNEKSAEVSVSGFKGPIIKAKAISDNIYKSVDIIIGKLEAQLRKKQPHLSMKRYDKNSFMRSLDYDR